MQQGRCTKGKQCTYAHGTHQLASFRNPNDNPGVKFHKTKLCKHFMQEGTCQHGTGCSYAHGEHELNTPIKNNNDFSYGQTFSGNSIGGNPSKYKQQGKQLLKLKLCFAFQQKGYCSKKNNCTFAHGEHELNTPQPNNNNNSNWNNNSSNNDPWADDNNSNNPKAMGAQNFGEMTFF